MRTLVLIIIMAAFLLSASSVLGFDDYYCGNLEEVARGEIKLGDAMFYCHHDPEVENDELFAGWLTVEESYSLLTDPETRHDWIILDVRKSAEYVGNVGQKTRQGHPMWLKTEDKKGGGSGNYVHSYHNPWLDAGFTPNLEFWARIQELEAAGIIQKGKTKIITMCFSGWLGHGAANFLAQQGYTVYNMGNGEINKLPEKNESGYYGWRTTHGLPTTCNINDDDCLIAPKYSGFNLYE